MGGPQKRWGSEYTRKRPSNAAVKSALARHRAGLSRSRTQTRCKRWPVLVKQYPVRK